MNSQLSPIAAALVAIIGRRLAMALMAHMNSSGPGYIYVPMQPKPGSVLVQIIGPAAAGKLCEVYGGRTIQVPKCGALRRAKRNQEIRSLAAAGEPQVEIARRFGMTDRHVRNVLTKGATEG